PRHRSNWQARASAWHGPRPRRNPPVVRPRAVWANPGWPVRDILLPALRVRETGGRIRHPRPSDRHRYSRLGPTRSARARAFRHVFFARREQSRSTLLCQLGPTLDVSGLIEHVLRGLLLEAGAIVVKY